MAGGAWFGAGLQPGSIEKGHGGFSLRGPAAGIALGERRNERVGCRERKRGTKEVNERARKRREGVKRNARDRALGAEGAVARGVR